MENGNFTSGEKRAMLEPDKELTNAKKSVEAE